MKVFKCLVLLFLLIFISSCGFSSTEEMGDRPDGPPEGLEEGIGTPGESIGGNSSFLIETKSILEYDTSSKVEKVGTISSSETIDIDTEVSGKLSQIYVKEGQEVVEGQVLAVLEDSYNKYYLELESAEIAYQKTLISKESEIISLDKKISDTKIDLDDALFNYENEKTTATEDLIEAKLNYENSDLVDTTSEAYLQLENAKLDYDNTVNSNIQQINTYVSNVQKEYNNLVINLDDVIDFSDELLGVTEDNKNEDDDFEDYLGAKDKSTKIEAKNNLRELIDYRKELGNIDIYSLDEDSLVDTMDSFYDGYEKINDLLGLMEVVLNNSISSVGAITDSEIDSYISEINSYQSSNQSNLSSFNTTRSSIVSFLNTYKDTELSALKSIELQEKQLQDSSITGETTYNKLVASIESNLYTYESKYNQAKLEYENAINNKEVSIKSLDNSIASAKNSRDKASLEYSKLTIKSPITGIISTVDADKNTDVSVGSKLFTVISNDRTQIEVSLTSTEVKNISIGDPVKVYYLDGFYYGEVYSKSYVADENLEYNVVVLLEENIELIGGSTIVEFATTHENILLPLTYVTVQGDNLGTLNYLKNGNLEEIEVTLGNIEGNNVEILSPLPSDLEIITTDLSNYNSLIQTLEVNNQ